MFESSFVIQLGHTIVSSVQKASSAQNRSAAFSNPPSCWGSSPRLLVRTLLTDPIELAITATLVGAMCSGSRRYEQAHSDQYLGHAHMMLHIDSRAHKARGIFQKNGTGFATLFSLRPITLDLLGKIHESNETVPSPITGVRLSRKDTRPITATLHQLSWTHKVMRVASIVPLTLILGREP